MTEQTTPETGARRPTVADVLAQDAAATAHLPGASARHRVLSGMQP